jgi:hypothetical protein
MLSCHWSLKQINCQETASDDEEPNGFTVASKHPQSLDAVCSELEAQNPIFFL